MRLFKKLFIKDWERTERGEVRLRYGITASVMGLIVNAVLFVFKLVGGLLSNSVTVIADAVNNFSDFGSSAVTLFGFKLSSRPADKEHPYGHARYEYVSALVVAFMVIAIGLMLAKTSIEKIISPEVVKPSIITYAALGFSILAKLFQAAMYTDFGKAIKSSALTACAADSRNDIIATSAALAATLLMHFTSVNIDGYAGAAVSIFILVSGVKLVKDTIDPLLGTVPDKELVDSISAKLLSYDGILGIHDLMIHNYGASQIFAVVHAELPDSADFMLCHDLIDEIERDFLESMNVHMCIHMDPVKLNDPMIDLLKDKITRALILICPDISLHDFRIVEGVTHTNVLFDAVLPYESRLTVEDIKKTAGEAINDGTTDYRLVVEIDREFVL